MMRAHLAGVWIGDGLDVAIMGALNVSPESFYSGSVVTGGDRLLGAAETMRRAGAAILDVGALSTAPYGRGGISEAEEADRLAWAVHLLATKLDVPLSADTSRAGPARAALDAGARILNDVSGLGGAPGLAALVAARGAGLVLVASERRGAMAGAPVDAVAALLEESLAIARAAGIPPERVVVDPGIGFFRRQRLAWERWDCEVLAGLERLRGLGRPIGVGVSRKSFIGALTGAADPGERLPGSLAAAVAAVLAGAHLVRTHDVEATRQAVQVAQAIRRARREAPACGR
jgi:dihydropteroate synthase